MAFRTSELRLILTARNEASRTLRRVGRDMGKLSDQERVKQQIRQTTALQKQQQIRRLGLRQELQSLTVGKQRLALDRQISIQNQAIRKSKDAIRRAEIHANKEMSKNEQQQLNTARRIAEQRARLAQPQLSPKNAKQARGILKELAIQQARLLKEAEDIPMGVTRARGDKRLAEQQLRNLKAGLADLGRQADVTRGKLKAQHEQINITRDRIKGLNAQLQLLNDNKLRQTASSMRHLGMAIATVGVISTAAFGVAARGAAEFSKEVTLAATQARKPEKSFASVAGIATNLNQIILDQMQKFPAASADMANSLYEIFSGTNIQKPKDAAAALETFNKAAVAGGTDLATMTQAGITLLNNFVGQGKEFKTLNSAMDLFFSSVRYGRMSAEQFANSLSNVVPIAETAGLKFRDVADAMAILTRQSGARFTSRDSTGLARLIEILGKTDVQAGLLTKGISVEKATGGMRPLLDILSEIKAKADLKPGSSTLNFFKEISALGGAGKGNAGTIQARRTFAFLINNMEEYRNVTKKVNTTQGEFNKSYQALAKTPGVKWDVTVNQLKALTIIVGQSVIPVFQELGFIVVRVIEYFNNMDKSTRDMIIRSAAVVSILAAVGGAFLAIGGGLLSLVLLLRRFTGSMSLARAGSAGLAAEAGFVSARFGILGGAIAAALLIFIKYPHAITAVTDAFGGLNNVLKAITIISVASGIGRIVAGLATIEAGAILATTKVVALRTALLRLTILGAITVPIVLKLAQDFDKDPRSKTMNKAENWWMDALGGVPLAGDTLKTVAKAGGQSGRNFFDWVGWSDKARAEMAKQKESNKITDMTTRGRAIVLYNQIAQNPYVPAYLKDTAFQAMQLGDIAALQKIDTFRIKASAGGAATTGRGTAGSLKAVNSVSQLQLDKRFAAGLTGLAKLKQISDDAVGIDAIAAMRNYDAALAALTAKFPQYKDKINDLLGAFMQLANIRMPDAQFTAAFARLEVLRKAAEKSTDPKVIEKYIKEKDKLEKKSADDQMEAATTAASHADDLRQEQIQKAKEAADKATQIAKEAAEKAKRLQEQNVANAKSALDTMSSNLFSFYQNAVQENRSMFGQLFNGPFMNSPVMQNRNQFGFSARGQDLVADMFSQVKQFKTFQNSLAALRKRGAPEELVNQIRQLGPEAQNQIDVLMKLPASGKNSWQKFVGFFNQGQKLIEQASQQDLKRQIKKWESFGKKVAQAIARGLSSETPGIENRIFNRVLAMFPGLAAQAHAKPKPTNFPRTGLSMGGGGNKNNNYTIQNNKTVHYNLPAHLAGSTIMTQIKAAHFSERNSE